LKLASSNFSERKAIILFGYVHNEAEMTPIERNIEIVLMTLELILEKVHNLKLGKRVETERRPLTHETTHQQLIVYAWEVPNR
jgi:hypothetical protein